MGADRHEEDTVEVPRAGPQGKVALAANSRRGGAPRTAPSKRHLRTWLLPKVTPHIFSHMLRQSPVSKPGPVGSVNSILVARHAL